MKLLETNARRVQNLSPMGIWLFIIGRVLAAFGLGILAMAYFPTFAFPVGLPLVVAGVITLAVAFIGFGRSKDIPPPGFVATRRHTLYLGRCPKPGAVDQNLRPQS